MMARRQPTVPRLPRTFGDWVSHYLPLWTAVFLVVLPNLFSNALRAKGAIGILGELSRWTADVHLGLLSFWTWALVTNAHDGRLVRSSGKVKGNVQERKTEFAIILCFLAFTLLFYVLCSIDIPVYVSVSLTLVSFWLAAIVLRSPLP